MSKVTLVTPNYNHARYLPEYFEAILSLSRTPDEIIIVDDGSTDNSTEIIKSYENKVPNLVLLRNKKNRGLHFTINYGIDNAKYDLVALSAADDFLLPDFFDKCISTFEKDPDLVLVFTNSLIFEDRKPYSFRKISYYPAQGPSIFTPDELVRICKNYPAFTITSNSCMYRKEVLLKCGKHDGELFNLSDFYLVVQICFSYKIAHIPDHLAAFRFVDNSYGRSFRFNFKKRWSLLSSMMTKIWSWEDDRARKRLIESGYLGWIGYFLILYLVFHPIYWRYLFPAIYQIVKNKLALKKLRI
jgi:glycosyltransferase involved in cell wall biosynthesis